MPIHPEDRARISSRIKPPMTNQPTQEAPSSDAVTQVKVPENQTPLNNDLRHKYLDVIRQGSEARDSGTGSPYHGHSLEHCLHAAGWVQRDLRLALDEAQAALASLPTAGLKAENERTAQTIREVLESLRDYRPGAAPGNEAREEFAKALFTALEAGSDQ